MVSLNKGKERKMKVYVTNKLNGKTELIILPCKPTVGDHMPVSYMSEKVVSVLFLTPMVAKEMNVAGLDFCDILVETE